MDDVKIKVASFNDKDAWDAYVDSRSGISPYCYFAWRQAVEKAYGHKGLYLIAYKDNLVVGVLPLICFRYPFSRFRYYSLPYCDVGGVYAESSQISTLLVNEALRTLRKKRGVLLEIRSGQDMRCNSEIQLNQPTVSEDKVRMLLQLPGSSDLLWSGFKSKLRSQIRKAEKNGLVFSWGTVSQLDDFYQVFTRNMHELGSPVHSKLWFEMVLESFAENARLGLVYNGEVAVGGAVILITGNSVSIPWASTLRDYNKLSPNMLLYWNLLQYAADNGKEVFDFGRSTLGEGTYRFKKQWGAEPEPLYWYTLGNSKDQRKTFITKSDNRKMLAVLWGKMPMPLTGYLGPRLRRYIPL